MNDRSKGHAQLAQEPGLVSLIRQMLEAQGVVDAPDPLFSRVDEPTETEPPARSIARLTALALGAPSGAD